MGSVTQIRVLGGTIGLAICSAVLNNHIKVATSKFLSAEQVASLLESFRNVKLLDPELQLRVRVEYATGYSQQMRAMLYICIVSLFPLVLLVERKPRRFEPGENTNSAATPTEDTASQH